jgi:3-methylcrotonyl-CoA carboxylase beta subunit
MTEIGQRDIGARLRDQYELPGRPVYSTARLWDDGIIDPRHTRSVVNRALATCGHGPIGVVATGTSGWDLRAPPRARPRRAASAA